MSTKAESVRADSQHKGPKPKKAKKLAQRKPHVHHEPVRTAKKGSFEHAIVPSGKRPSPRKSPRAAESHATADSSPRRRTERSVRAPKRRALRAHAKAKRAS